MGNARTGLLGRDPVLAALGYAMAMSLLVTLAAMALDQRQYLGESVWLKPIKFQIALTILFLTLAFFAKWLPAEESRWIARIRAALVIATILEMSWIIGAASFGVPSHYNPEPVMRVIYQIMGLVAVVISSAPLFYGIAIWRNRESGLAPALHLSFALGLVLTFVLTLPAAFILAGGEGHLVGEAATGASVPLMGWSREVGDLRVGHFLATHALHALPIAGVLALGLGRAGKPFVWLAAGLYAALVAFTVWQALSGQPFIAVSAA